MPSLHERTRNNVRAGIFVTMALALAMGAVIVLTDAWETLTKPTERYTVRFEVSGGVKNLKEGAEVRIGGIAMGKVVAIRPVFDEGQAFEKIDVHFKVDQHVRLYADAQVLVSSPLIGADAWLELPFVGTPAAGAPADGRLDGISGPGVLTALLGPDNAAKADQMVEDAARFTSFLGGVEQRYEQDVYPILQDAKATSGDVKAIASDLRNERWPSWAQRVDEIMTRANDITAAVDAAIAEGHGLLADSRAVVADNRQKIDATIDNVQAASNTVRDITSRINEQTIVKVETLLDTGKTGLESAMAVIQDVNQQFDLWAPDVREALANARLTAQQLKLTSIEVRRSPWKLLYRPSQDEVEHELLYAAARPFALAASDLKATSESLRRVMERHGDELASDPQTLQRLNTYLLDSLDNYEDAQQRLIDVLLSDAK